MFGFNINKTIQAAAYIIKREPGKRLNYMKLLKLLYLADRESLKRRGAPICGDTPWAMERGPVPGATLDIIKGNDPATIEWEQFIHRVKYDVKLTDDPGTLELSRAELKILNELCEQFDSCDEWEMVKWCHENLPEYEKNWNQGDANKRSAIPLADILKAIGRSGDRSKITAQATEDVHLRKLFADHSPSG